MPRLRRYQTDAERQASYRARRRQRLQAPLAAAPAAPGLATLPANARWNALWLQAQGLLQTIADERQAYFDQRSELWQDDERGEAFSERSDEVEQALETLRDLGSF